MNCAHAAYLLFLLNKRQFEKVRNTTATLFQVFISCGINSLLWRKLMWSEKEHFSVELKPTCADGLIPTPLSVTLTTANSDIQATGQRESQLAAHFKQGRKGVSGREEASHWVFTGGWRPGTSSTWGEKRWSGGRRESERQETKQFSECAGLLYKTDETVSNKPFKNGTNEVV